MDNLVDYTKQEILQAVYDSIARMNNYVLEENTEGVLAEKNLQEIYRSRFEELSNVSEPPANK